MQILITGADRPIGATIAAHLEQKHTLRLAGLGPEPHRGAPDGDYRQADLRSPEAVKPLVEGMDAVVHAAEFEPAPQDGPAAAQETLHHASLGTYILYGEAREAGVERVVHISTLRLFEAYRDDYVIDEMWRPRPSTDVAQLAPYLSELSGREFAREGGICGVCLRFAPIGDDPERETRQDDALSAVDCALAMPFEVPGYRWHVFHVASSPRFVMRHAQRILGFDRKEYL